MDAIILTAAQILRDEGEHAVSTKRVARQAGVSVGTLYQYFADREAILAEVRKRHGRWLAAETRNGVKWSAELPFREGVRVSLERMVALHGSDDRLRHAVATPLTPQDFVGFRERTEKYLRANADQMRPVDPALAAAVITRATEALVYGMSRDEPEWLHHSDFVEEVTELVIGYLAPRDPARGRRSSLAKASSPDTSMHGSGRTTSG